MKAGPIKEYDIAKTQFFKGHAVISGFFSYNMIDLFFSVKKKIIKETKLEERKKIISLQTTAFKCTSVPLTNRTLCIVSMTSITL